MMQTTNSNLASLIAAKGGFIKRTVSGGVGVDSAQKALLNRKGNILFNEGNVEGARRIFMTTGYSDGLSRVGDYYRSKGRAIDALNMYKLAPDKKKSDELIMEIAMLIKTLIDDGGTSAKTARLSFGGR